MYFISRRCHVLVSAMHVCFFKMRDKILQIGIVVRMLYDSLSLPDTEIVS